MNNISISLLMIRSFGLWTMENILSRKELLLIRKMIFQWISIIILNHWFIQWGITRRDRSKWQSIREITYFNRPDWIYFTVRCSFWYSRWIRRNFFRNRRVFSLTVRIFERILEKNRKTLVWTDNHSIRTMEHFLTLYFARKYFEVTDHMLHERLNSISVSTTMLY